MESDRTFLVHTIRMYALSIGFVEHQWLRCTSTPEKSILLYTLIYTRLLLRATLLSSLFHHSSYVYRPTRAVYGYRGGSMGRI